MLTCTIKKSKKVSIEKKIQSLRNNLPIAMQKIMEHGQQTALNNKVGSKDKRLIPFIIEKNGDKLKGTLYTNFDYASFLEYGTGTYAELPHIGTTKTFEKSGYRYWYLPKEKADAKGVKISPNRLITIGDNQYYIMYAQPSKPFMRPTAFDLEKSAVDILKYELRKK